MSRPYEFIFFDLDHTLWDHDTNSADTLAELYDTYQLESLGVSSADALFKSFSMVNDQLWPMYNAGEIDKFYLRNERFRLVFEEAGIADLPDSTWLKKFNDDYLSACPRKSMLMDGAMEVLQCLSGKYPMFIITNGFEEIQQIKMNNSGIADFFDKVITSEKAGFKKPFNGIFYYAMKHCAADPELSLMIGDNLQADIIGARDFGIDQVYFNPQRNGHSEKITHEIFRLTELLEIL